MQAREILVTKDQAKKADFYTIHTLGTPGIILMERAGRAVAYEVLSLAGKLKLKTRSLRVSIFCGRGNNGGDGLVSARYLQSAGVAVSLYLACSRRQLKSDAACNMLALEKRKTPFAELTDTEKINVLKRPLKSDIIIDAIFGTGFHGKPNRRHEKIIKLLNNQPARRVAIDIPSGLDATTGIAQGAVIIADITVAMGFAKAGFCKNDGPFCCGKIQVADIGLKLKRKIYGKNRNHTTCG
jgi:ADP-dependent NAD(P)H-hydrate dehydratase / NAD(P)H-hydrate epimerase